MRILLVEDEHRIAANIKKGLELERWSVDIAYDGEDGYDRASTESYDILILDRMLPKMDGMAICRLLREEHIHTPILMLTAKSQVADRVEGLDCGADDYLTKPFSFEELIARIRALHRRPNQLLATTLTVDDVELNPQQFTVFRAGTSISLSNKEFSLLEFLLRHVNTIVTKQQIIDHVWDYDANVLPNTIEVYIRNLRTKLEEPFANKKKIIHTVRGFGYKIGA